jgi:hypothetical protein
MEMRIQANVGFHMYSLDGFLNYAKKFLKLDNTSPDKETDKDVKKVNKALEIELTSIQPIYDVTVPNYIQFGQPAMWPQSPLISGGMFQPPNEYSSFGVSPGPFYGNLGVHPHFGTHEQSPTSSESAAAIIKNAIDSSLPVFDPRRARVTEALNILRRASRPKKIFLKRREKASNPSETEPETGPPKEDEKK